MSVGCCQSGIAGEAEPPQSPGLAGALYALDYEDPAGGLFPVNGIVATGQDTVDGKLVIRAFSFNTDGGVIFELLIPANRTMLILTPHVHSLAAPGGTSTIRFALYGREFTGSFSAKLQLSTIAIPNSTDWVSEQKTVALSALGIAAGDLAQIELIRDWNDAGDTLNQDLGLYALEIGYT